MPSKLPDPLSADLLWGGSAIAKEIGMDAKWVYYHASQGHLRSVRRVGAVLVASRAALRAELAGALTDNATA